MIPFASSDRMENPVIKKATPDDWKPLQQISQSTFAETFSSFNTVENMRHYLDNSFSSEKLKAELSDKNSEFYFAVYDDQVIGYLKINTGPAQTELKDENSLEIERIYVLKEFHGKKIGQLLFGKAMEISKKIKTRFIWLGVWEKNPRAIRFYEKNGFVEFNRHVFMLGSDLQTDIMMKRVL